MACTRLQHGAAAKVHPHPLCPLPHVPTTRAYATGQVGGPLGLLVLLVPGSGQGAEAAAQAVHTPCRLPRARQHDPCPAHSMHAPQRTLQR